MACRLLLFRVSFTGELGFEVNVPADFGQAVWEAIYAAGQQVRHHPLRHRSHARAARREGLHHRRPGDRRHGDARRRRPRLGDRQDQARLRRQALAAASLHERGAIASNSSACSQPTRRSCSRKARRSCRVQDNRLPCGRSDMLRRPITAPSWGDRSPWPWSSGGRARMGETLYVPTGHGDIAVKVTSPVFYDPEGARLNG